MMGNFYLNDIPLLMKEQYIISGLQDMDEHRNISSLTQKWSDKNQLSISPFIFKWRTIHLLGKYGEGKISTLYSTSACASLSSLLEASPPYLSMTMEIFLS